MFQRVINATGSDVKVLPLAANAGDPYIAPTPQTFFDGSYPMHNGAYLYLNRVPGKPLSPREKEFVRFVLSREGRSEERRVGKEWRARWATETEMRRRDGRESA